MNVCYSRYGFHMEITARWKATIHHVSVLQSNWRNFLSARKQSEDLECPIHASSTLWRVPWQLLRRPGDVNSIRKPRDPSAFQSRYRRVLFGPNRPAARCLLRLAPGAGLGRPAEILRSDSVRDERIDIAPDGNRGKVMF